MNERDMRGIMNDQDLVDELRGYAQWAKDVPDGLVPGKHITHWMPLPTGPEVENA